MGAIEGRPLDLPVERKDNFRMVIEVRPAKGPLLMGDEKAKGLPMESQSGTDARSSLEMNALDLLNLLEKKPADVLEMVRANIMTTYVNESRRRESAKHFGGKN